MKVYELIKELHKFDQQLPIMLVVENAVDWEDAETILTNVSIASNHRYIELKGMRE